MRYRIYALAPTQYEITGVVQTCEVKEMHEQLAAECIINLANVQYQKKYLSGLLVPPYKVMVAYEGKEMFQGHIVESEYDSAREKLIDLTCYDPTWYMQQSQIAYYIPANTSSNKVIEDIASLAGFAIVNKAPNMPLQAKKYQSNTVAEIILDILKMVKEYTGIECILRSSSGLVEIITKGFNSTMYYLDVRNVENIQQGLSIQNMVTRAKIVYTDSEGGNISNEAELSNNTSYGIIQRIVNRNSNQTLAQAKAEAQSILDEHSKPEETIGFQSVDIPLLRKSDRISVAAGSIVSELYVSEITHDIREGKMRVELSR